MSEALREIHIRVPQDAFLDLRLLAAQMDTSLNALINDAVSDYLTANPPKK